jgi:hypothetical protein
MTQGSGGEREALDFSLSQNRYDLTTYFGRLRHFVEITNPFTLLYSNKDIHDAQNILTKYKLTGLSSPHDEVREMVIDRVTLTLIS